MSTITNKRILKARILRSWAHDSAQFHFPRTHDSKLPFKDEKRPGWGECLAWAATFFALGLFMLYVLDLG